MHEPASSQLLGASHAMSSWEPQGVNSGARSGAHVVVLPSQTSSGSHSLVPVRQTLPAGSTLSTHAPASPQVSSASHAVSEPPQTLPEPRTVSEASPSAKSLPPPTVAVAVTVNPIVPPGVVPSVVTVTVVVADASASGAPASETETGTQAAPAGSPEQVMSAVKWPWFWPRKTVTENVNEAPAHCCPGEDCSWSPTSTESTR